MHEKVLVPSIDFNALHLHCPICGFEYNHAGWPRQMDGAVIGCRDDSGQGGLYIPITGECGHEWAIALANHKGYEFMDVLAGPVKTAVSLKKPMANKHTAEEAVAWGEFTAQLILLRIELKRINQVIEVHLKDLERRLEKLEQRQQPLDARGRLP